MVDYTSGEREERKKGGCLTVFLIVLIFIAGLAAAVYFFLPSILAGAASGGAAYRIMPEEVRNQLDAVNVMIDENLDQLAEYGLDRKELGNIVESVDYDTVEALLDDPMSAEVRNTSELIDWLDGYVDLSAVDLERVKRDYDSDIPEGELNRALDRLRDNPLLGAMAFNIFKETLLKSLAEEDPRATAGEETWESSDSGGSTTTKKKK